MKKVRLNLGAGDIPIDGYINIDRKTGQEAYPLAYEDNSVDEIRASHILEHFGMHDVVDVLKEWVSKLKPGGLLKIAVPDFDKIVKLYEEGDSKTSGYLCGGQVDENDYHKSIFNQETLTTIMEDAGIELVTSWSSQIKDCASLPVSLNLQGNKASNKEDELKSILQRPEDQFVSETKTVSMKIGAVMSAPRLGFSNNLMIATKVYAPLGIDFEIGYGVFWGQVLTRMIDKQIARGMDLITVLDYDSYYEKEHFLALCQLMQEYPEVDAIVPVQVKRENDSILVGVEDQAKAQANYMANADLIEVDAGNFGLSIFRTSAFKKLKKPWFVSVPNDKGEWGDGRLDEDIYFWKNWRSCGLKVCLAPQVKIGHIQLMITWPGDLVKGTKPTHQYLNDCAEDGIPEWCKVSKDYKPKVV